MLVNLYVVLLLFAVFAVMNANEEPKSKYPSHWGNPPLRQTRDIRPLPGGYGMGSGTLAKWIGNNLKVDQENGVTEGAGVSEGSEGGDNAVGL